MLESKCPHCGETVYLTSPLAAFDTVCSKCGRRILEKEPLPVAEAVAECSAALPVPSQQMPPSVRAKRIGGVVGALGGAVCIYLIITYGGTQERSFLLALGGGMIGVLAPYLNPYGGAYASSPASLGPDRPENRYGRRYINGFCVLICFVGGFWIGSRMEQHHEMTLQKALARLPEDSEENRNKLNEDFLRRLPPDQRTEAERRHERFLRGQAIKYLCYFACGALGAGVLGVFFGRQAGEMLGEIVEVARMKRS